MKKLKIENIFHMIMKIFIYFYLMYILKGEFFQFCFHTTFSIFYFISKFLGCVHARLILLDLWLLNKYGTYGT